MNANVNASFTGPLRIRIQRGKPSIAGVTLQTPHFSIGPLDPTPPLAFPPAQRALWFAMFTAGMFFPFYLAAAGGLIPVLRVLTRPLRAVPLVAGAITALVLGGVLGIGVFALATRTPVVAFIDRIQY